jgi:fatty-acyl-CoA synthase
MLLRGKGAELGPNATRFPLAERTMLHVLRHRAEQHPDRTWLVFDGRERLTYGEAQQRVNQVGHALGGPMHVGLFLRNQPEFFPAFYGAMAARGVAVPLNADARGVLLERVITKAELRVIVARADLLDRLEALDSLGAVELVVVAGATAPLPERLHAAHVVSWEDWLDNQPTTAPAELPDSSDVALIQFTSGTTGRSKGVVYSHRAVVLSAINWTMADSVGIRGRDTLLAVPPMFHINGWGFPYIAALVGAKLVLPGRHLEPARLLDLIASERVTVSGGVPAIWNGVLHALEAGAPYDVSSLRLLVSGGSAVPESLIRGWNDRYGVTVLHLWGMTEMTAVGTVGRCPPEIEQAPIDEQYAYRAKQGQPTPFVEVRARCDSGLVPWDGETMGELEARGPMVASEYYNNPDGADRFTDDGWLRTGDIATIDPTGCVHIRDRAKDLIKSGGEWISSVALENALMAHPAVAEAAVVAVPHPKWDERPLAVVVIKAGQTVTAEALRAFLAPRFASWSLPDAFEFVDSIPRTATGKFLKSALRARYRDYHAALES